MERHYDRRKRAGGVFALHFIGIVLFLYLLMELFDSLPLPIEGRYPLGLTLAVLGVFLLYRRRGPAKYLNFTARTEGKISRIIQLDRYSVSGFEDAYAPEFTYSANGVEYVKRSDIAHAVEKFSEGQTVSILYNPKNPDQYCVLEQHRLSNLLLILGEVYWRPVGVVFLIVGVAFTIRAFQLSPLF